MLIYQSHNLPFTVLLYIIIVFVGFVSPKNLICRRIPQLTGVQLKICERDPHLLTVIRSGIQLALAECRLLFAQQEHFHQSWNCTAWVHNSLNRLYINITDKQMLGTKEAAFAHALFTAGVTHALSEACSRSDFIHCPCGSTLGEPDLRLNDVLPDTDIPWRTLAKQQHSVQASQRGTEHQKTPTQSVGSSRDWKWKGCAPNVQFGVSTTRQFLDSSEHKRLSAYSLLNLHNNNVGRRLIKDGLQIRCQCHGFSGFCTFRTCWYTLRPFRRSTQLLYERYTNAKQVSYPWLMKAYQKMSKTSATLTTTTTEVSAEPAASRRANRASKLMRHLQSAITNLTLTKFNQPNPLRGNEISTVARKRDLIYLTPSVSQCQMEMVVNRTCTVPPSGDDWPGGHEESWPPLPTCDKACCGRGYRLRTRIHTEKCDCQFQFCCSVKCHSCTISSTEYECL